MKRNLLIAVLVVICIFVVTVVYLRLTAPLGAPARIAVADDRAFFPLAHHALASAEKSIDVILYQSRFYFHYPLSSSNTLLADLAEAADRGVRVRVILERADWNLDNTEENRDVWHVLSQGDIEFYFDPVGTTSHSKLAIIDGRYAIVGSANWSHYSLDNNHEANIVIDSEAVGKVFRDYFEQIAQASERRFIAPIEAIGSADVAGWGERYALIKDVADSGAYDHAEAVGLVFFDDLVVTARERPLEEVLAVDSLFFTKVKGESVRILGRIERDDEIAVSAMDLELDDTPTAMARAFGIEREQLRQKKSPEPSLEWVEASRVKPIPNREYGPELKRLIRSATKRIWVALLDARYYESTPRTARTERGPDEPASLTNELLGELVNAAVNGVDVRLVCDMGWQGSPPPTKTAFLERLKASGAQVYEDPSDVTTHAKVLIVDDDFVVVGSTNWSYHALEENNETAVVIESQELNAHYADYIDAIMEAGTPFEIEG